MPGFRLGAGQRRGRVALVAVLLAGLPVMRRLGGAVRGRAGLGPLLSLPGTPALRTLLVVGAAAAVGALGVPAGASAAPRHPAGPGTIAGAAAAAQHRFGVPAPLLEAICYLEGHLSGHGGAPSSEGGYGCMDLARNSHLDTLDQAARLLGVPVSSLQRSLPLNIAGAAAVLRADAIGSPGDVTDESNNIETMISYDTLAQQPDAAGTGDTMYEIWYGATLSPSSWSATGTQAWIAVPPRTAEQGHGTVVTLSGRKGKSVSVYGKPGGTSGNVIGSTPGGSAYLSPWSVTVSGTTWYAINYNHRQEWVPASEVSSTRTT